MRLSHFAWITGVGTAISVFVAGIITDNPNRYLNIPCGFVVGALTGAALYLVFTWLYGNGEW